MTKSTLTPPLLFVAAALAMAISACAPTAQADDDLAEGIVGSQDVFDHGANYRSYAAKLDHAHDNVAACMHDRGFEYARPRMEPLGRPGAQQAYTDTGMSDLDFAKDWGFALTTMQTFTPIAPDGADIPDQGPDPLAGVPAQDRAAYGVALNGGDGCKEQGFVNLGHGNDEFFDKADAVRRAKEAFAASQPVADFYADWAECMDQRGHDYSSPVAAYLSLETEFRDALEADDTRFVDTTLRQREIALAVDTVECGGPSRDLLDPQLTDVWLEVATAILS